MARKQTLNKIYYQSFTINCTLNYTPFISSWYESCKCANSSSLCLKSGSWEKRSLYFCWSSPINMSSFCNCSMWLRNCCPALAWATACCISFPTSNNTDSVFWHSCNNNMQHQKHFQWNAVKFLSATCTGRGSFSCPSFCPSPTHNPCYLLCLHCQQLEMLSLKSNPITGLDRAWGFQEVEALRFQDNGHMKVVRLSALHTGCQ